VRPGGGDLEGTLGVFLPAHVGKVQRLAIMQRSCCGAVPRHRKRPTLGEERDDSGERFGAQHIHPVHHAGFGHVGFGNDDTLYLRAPGAGGNAQRTSDGPHISLESQLAHDHVVVETRQRAASARLSGAFQLVGGSEDAECDGEVKGRALFSDVGGGEIDGDALEGKLEARVGDGGVDPLTPLFDGAMRQPHRRERR
jgi:hypothetical protein